MLTLILLCRITGSTSQSYKVGHDTGASSVYFLCVASVVLGPPHHVMRSFVFLLASSAFTAQSSLVLTWRHVCLGYSRAEALCKEYRQTKGPGTTAKPSEQLFFLKLGGLIKNTLEKCQRENGFMWVGQDRHTLCRQTQILHMLLVSDGNICISAKNRKHSHILVDADVQENPQSYQFSSIDCNNGWGQLAGHLVLCSYHNIVI